MLKNLVPNSWQQNLKNEFDKEYFKKLEDAVEEEYKNHTVYPPKEEIFNALNMVKPEDTKVVIIGQDPYIKEGQAHGLSFSVKDGVEFPKSLKNIFTELHDDIGCDIPSSGSLIPWAQQGVLLLNTTLTVRENESNSHANFGWSIFTAEIIRAVLKTDKTKVFILWGKNAKDMFNSVYANERNVFTIESPHPSPLSAYRGFFGSKPFSRTNNFLKFKGEEPIDWRLA